MKSAPTRSEDTPHYMLKVKVHLFFSLLGSAGGEEQQAAKVGCHVLHPSPLEAQGGAPYSHERAAAEGLRLAAGKSHEEARGLALTKVQEDFELAADWHEDQGAPAENSAAREKRCWARCGNARAEAGEDDSANYTSLDGARLRAKGSSEEAKGPWCAPGGVGRKEEAKQRVDQEEARHP